jgi:CheY-like chemotaxis protein
MDNLNEIKNYDTSDYVNKSILLVEDEETYRRFMAKIIEKYIKCNVKSCANPKEAFDYLNTEIPDLIIMDLQMPFMDGLTALKYIRASESTANIPVIICSALGFESIIKTMSQYNVADFIVKPTDANVIVKKIIKALNDSQQVQGVD